MSGFRVGGEEYTNGQNICQGLARVKNGDIQRISGCVLKAVEK
jgi:hypothetical protein